MKKLPIIFVIIGFLSCAAQSDTSALESDVSEELSLGSALTQSEINVLDSVNIEYKFRGSCYAYSNAENAEESNGEAHSDNLPKKIDNSFPSKGLFLIINRKELIKLDSTTLGCRLYLVNTTDSVVKLDASDSRLNIVAEALNDKNEWVTISYLPSSGCGNSYHTVVLDQNEYWDFDIPVFKGSIKSKLRYTLIIDQDKKISSNEIDTYLNKGQFSDENKEGHINGNIMDPYRE